jgi:hypothetical protein
VDVVYPFLITLQTNGAKKVKLALAFLSRKGFDDALLRGELVLEANFL